MALPSVQELIARSQSAEAGAQAQAGAQAESATVSPGQAAAAPAPGSPEAVARTKSAGVGGEQPDETQALLPSEYAAQHGGLLARGLLERSADPAARLLGLHGPQDKMTTATDLVQLGTTGAALLGFSPALALAMGVGSGVQGVGEELGLTPNTARMVGSASELGFSIASARRVATGAAEAGESLLNEGRSLRKPITTVPGSPQMTGPETLGADIKAHGSKALQNLKSMIGERIGTAEDAIARSAPRIDPAHPAYGDIARELNTLTDRGIDVGGATERNLMQRMRDQINHTIPKSDPPIPDPQPLNTSDVVKLRRAMVGVEDRPYNVATGDMENKFLKVFRRELGDALEKVAPNDKALAYSTARNDYLNTVVRPSNALRNILSQNTAPAQAYDRIFSLSDNRQAYRALYQVLKEEGSPTAESLMSKLRAGFIEKLAGTADERTAVNVIRQNRSMLASTGLYSEDELNSLDYLAKTKQLPDAAQRLVGAFKGSTIGKVVGAEALFHIATTHPVGALGLAVAGGGVQSLRRLLLAPEGSKAAIALGGTLINHASRAMMSMRKGQTDHPGTEDGLTWE